MCVCDDSDKIAIFISMNIEQDPGWQGATDGRVFTGAYLDLMMIYKYEDITYLYLFSRPMS